MKYTCLLILLTFIFAGCKDCTRYTRGYVVDKNNNKAIKNVEIRSFAALNDRKRDERFVHTDSTGWFETAFALNSVAKCGNLKLVVSHAGYHTQYIVELPIDDTIYLEKIKL